MIFNEKSADIYDAYLKLSPLIEEDPSLGLRYDPKTKEIRVKLMGDIQTEVLTKIIKDRFGFDVSFGEGSILYKESICNKVYGTGHFEPLMHYAEVRLRLEPAERGAGLLISTNCPQDRLKNNWQRLILSHLEGRVHRGVLTRSPITDIKITLIAGRAHPKHTEGGDFREATFRALRQGLMKAESILLEPTFDFTIELPSEYLGKAMTDISNMHGECEPPEFIGDVARLCGNCPVYTMRSYAKELRAYTHGAGRITLTVGEYAPCHNAEQIIAERGYDPESDTRNYADSIFCKNGSGYIVPWYEADAKMHTENPEEDEVRESDTEGDDIAVPERARAIKYTGTAAEDKELMKIFESTYGKIKRRSAPERIENAAKAEEKPKRKKAPQKGEDYLIIDGYNLIFAWDELKALADAELSHARDTLIRLVCNYRGYKKCTIILVFDAYKRKENEGSVEEIGGITVVYTKERQTADAYIEKATYSLSDKNSVRVVTSDFVAQLVVLGNGAIRVSTREFIAEINSTAADIKAMLN
jgi:predicted RNA-binding protein with PIN domain